MCRIEQFYVVYPDGTREREEQVVPCSRGTRSQPCRHAEVVPIGERFASPSDLRHRMQPRIIPVEPRDVESARLRPSSREKARGPIEGLGLSINFWNPFSSKKKERKEKTHFYLARKTKRPETHPTVIQHQPPGPPPPPRHFEPPVHGQPPVVIPIQPPNNNTPHRSPEREPRRRRRPIPVVIHQPNREDEDESPSPPEASREHGRRTRSLSPVSRYHVEKELIRQRELRQRERQERIRREEREARERAERIAIHERLERQRERDEHNEREERIRQEREARQRERLALERELRRQQEERDREQAAFLQDQEVRRQQRIEERARIVQEQEDRRRLRAADRARRDREERADIERRRAAERLRRYRDAEEQRYARARQANIPHRPRHPAYVHQYEDHVDRGERFIRDAIREENLRQFERRARWPHGGYDDGSLRRRNTIDGGRQWFDGQRWRRDRR